MPRDGPARVPADVAPRNAAAQLMPPLGQTLRSTYVRLTGRRLCSSLPSGQVAMNIRTHQDNIRTDRTSLPRDANYNPANVIFFTKRYVAGKTLSMLLGILCAAVLSACVTGDVNQPTSSVQAVSSSTVTSPCAPHESQIVCEDRLASQRITPLPSPTLSVEFLTAEAEYQQRLLRQTPTSFPPTPTPTPSYVLLPGAQKGMMLLRSHSLYQERPLFEMTYAEAAWRLEDTNDGPVLVHNTITGCRLLWLALPTEMAEAPVIEQKELAGYTVEVRKFSRSGTIAYGFSIDRGYYPFGLFFPSLAMNECQAAGETVLNTFRVVSD